MSKAYTGPNPKNKNLSIKERLDSFFTVSRLLLCFKNLFLGNFFKLLGKMPRFMYAKEWDVAQLFSERDPQITILGGSTEPPTLLL